MRFTNSDFQGHPTQSMRAARKAGIIAADGNLDTIEQPFRYLPVPYELASYPRDGLIHGKVVVAGRHDKVDLPNSAALVHPLLVDECPPRRFNDPYPLFVVYLMGIHPDVRSADGFIFDE